LTIAGDVVAVGMAVQNEQWVVLPGMPLQPCRHQVIDHRSQREELGRRGGAGVDQDRTVAAEHQEHERRLVVDRHVLPQDHGVLVAPVDLDVGIGVVLRRLRPVDPGDAQQARPTVLGPSRPGIGRLDVTRRAV
jgi:hypothetical protein